MKNLRKNIVHALGHIPGEKSRAMIESRLNDPSEKVQDEAIHALRGRHSGDGARAALELMLIKSSDMLRLSATEELASLGDAQADAWLEQATQSPDAAIRAGAMNAWGKRGDDRALAALEKALSDPDARTHDNAVYALGQIGGDRALTLLESVLNDPRADARYVAVLAIGNIGGERAVSILEPLLNHKDNQLRYDALVALSKTGSDRVRAIYHSALNNSHTWVRKRAVIVLADMGDETVIAEVGTPTATRGMGTEGLSAVMHNDSSGYSENSYRNGLHSIDFYGGSCIGPKWLPILERALASREHFMPAMAVQFARSLGARNALYRF